MKVLPVRLDKTERMESMAKMGRTVRLDFLDPQVIIFIDLLGCSYSLIRFY
jgi:hypothetical protein